MDVLTGDAGDTISSRTIMALIEKIDGVFRLADHECLEAQLNRLKTFLIDIFHQFQDETRTLPEMVSNSLRRMDGAVGNARQLIDLSQRPQQQYLDCLLFKPRLSEQIREWKASFNELFKELQTIFSVFCNGPEIVSSSMSIQTSQSYASGFLANAPNWGVRQDALQRGKGKGLLEDKPDNKSVRSGIRDAKRQLRTRFGIQSSEYTSASGFLANTLNWGVRHNKSVRLGIRDSKRQLRTWLTADEPSVHIIAVIGMVGVGKTTLLREMYDTYKVSEVFDVVIWVTVGHRSTSELQNSIARAINLDLSIHHSFKMKKRKLLAYLKNKKFLLILDDLWSSLDLKGLGVDFINGKESKVLLSSRCRVETNADYSLLLQPLSPEEAWELFRDVAFRGGHFQEDLEHIARQVADQCNGLPLAINVVAASMLDRTTKYELGCALRDLRHYSALDDILMWGFDRLPNNGSKVCILYFALFPENEEIEFEKLVALWIAEGFVQRIYPANSMDAAHNYIKLLVDRHLVQVTHIPHGLLLLKTHNVLRQIAISIGADENYIGRARQRTISPDTVAMQCKRLSFYGNDILSLPRNLNCTNLVSLLLGGNKSLEEVPTSFLVNLTRLRVLDLSRTQIKLLPITLWQLKELRYLDLSYTQIEDISHDIKNLCKLRFLNVCQCSNLKTFPHTIGKLLKLQFLDMSGCSKLHSLPSEIHELKNLKYFRRSQYSIML